MSPLSLFCVIGLVLALLVQVSSKQVANFIAPKGPGFLAIPRTLLSVLWFTFAPVIAIVLELVFFIVLLLSRA